MKVSVIIPIYKVEAYIERCARALMEQTLDDVEFIFVDDCSPDESMKVLESVLADYPQRKSQTHILRHETNCGLPAARNTGLDAATGDYIFHCDSDDYLEHDALERMYAKAIETDADIVYSDWYLTFGEGSSRYMSCPEYDTAEKALRGLLHGSMKYNVWNKLIKRELYYDNLNDNENENEKVRVRVKVKVDSVRFPDGHGMGEDMTMILLFAKAKKVAYLPICTYHYVRQNENAFTAVRSEASYENLLFNANRVIDALMDKVPEEDLACFKLNTKYPFLISNRREDYERWHRWFPEANLYISSHQVSRRARFLERVAISKYYWILQIHYVLLQTLLRLA